MTTRTTANELHCAPIREAQIEATVAFLARQRVPIGGARSERLYRFLCRRSVAGGSVTVVAATLGSEIAGAVVAIADQRRFWRLLPLVCPTAALEIGWHRCSRWLARRSAAGKGRLAAASDTVLARRLPPPPPTLWKRSDKRIARLQYIAVAEESRGRGLGVALHERLMRELHAKGVRLVEASIAAHNTASIRLHSRSGWTLYSDGRRVLCERRLDEQALA